MRLSHSFTRTLKEIPREAQIPSHQLMFRAGMIQQLSSGIYNYLPLALRSIRKIEKIIREELNRRGCEEVLMPAVQPGDLWVESGRWSYYGPELLRFKDRKGGDYCLGPTHEEVITDMARRNLRSYKQLPWNLYQIQNKFRDEIRPRFGLMRGREFLMKDAYSFDCDPEAAGKSYELMYQAYTAIFNRCGLAFRAVEAATGNIGGDRSHEFQVLADTGEDLILSCVRCDYAANEEKAVVPPASETPPAPSGNPVEKVATTGARTIQEVSDFLSLPPARFIKSLLYEADSLPVLVLIAGDREVNEAKLQALLGAGGLRLASEEMVQNIAGAPRGYLGPAGLKEKVKILADLSVSLITDGITGANEENYHLKNVNAGRDYQADDFVDISFAKAGGPCPRCDDGALEARRGIEAGQVFYLGDKYSQTMGCSFLDEKGVSRPALMGCYGIGIGRTMAASIEQNHDENGIIWPLPIAPWEVVILPLQGDDPQVREAGERLYAGLTQEGIEVVIDDRRERGGFKFKDADLIGYPVQVVLGRRSVGEGLAEIKFRATGKKEDIPLDQGVNYLKTWVEKNRQIL